MNASQAIREIARREGKTEREILDAMQEALDEGMKSTDPAVQAAWRDIPHAGEKPTPEEVILYIVRKMKAENLN